MNADAMKPPAYYVEPMRTDTPSPSHDLSLGLRRSMPEAYRRLGARQEVEPLGLAINVAIFVGLVAAVAVAVAL